MNNATMYSTDNAGGIPYPETEKYAYDRWFTTTGLTDGSEYKTIRFNIRQDNLYLHWTNAYLEIHGQLVKKADGAAYPTGSKITLIHNAIPHMFSNVKLTIGTQLVENVNQPGHVSSMMYDVLYPRSKGKTDGLQFLWQPDTDTTTDDTNKGFTVRQQYIIEAPHTKGTFKLRIPLMMFYGFMENFLALRGYPYEIELVRGPDYPAIFRDDAADEGKLVFKEFILDIPVIDPSNSVLLESLKGIKDPQPYLYSFRNRHGMFAPIPANIHDFQLTITTDSLVERPQMILVGLQLNPTMDQKFNHALYSNQNVETMYVKMNNEQYPTTLIKANWTENDSGFFYESQEHVRANYLQYPARYTEGNMMNPANFRDLYTIYCFDVTKGNYALGGNSIVSSLHIHFKDVTKAHLRVYVAWFSDRTIEFFTDGKPFNIKTMNHSGFMQLAV